MEKAKESKKYGEFLKHHRLTSGYATQKVLAEKAGLSTATISKIESNYQCPEPRTIQLLSEHLHSTNFEELMKAFDYPSTLSDSGLRVDYPLFRRIDTYISYRDQIRQLENNICIYQELISQQPDCIFKESLMKNLNQTISDLEIYKQKISGIEKELRNAGVQFTPPR
ncbi:helix-turn-helix transcriptional regulator [Bacillus sp. ISL-41]|uniref:helix-turn-helix domain-containing protein n=1 Tax=Bacillus sp. ISL-41 TaxID=2819127 RepID=UPI001BEC6631|nr:helix-turn-helix transcriptional regulator [Bacillus sp. ISL-41]